jgi:hypothetical protein
VDHTILSERLMMQHGNEALFLDGKAFEKFKCPICLGICQAAVGCERNDHLMCEGCAAELIAEGKRCPFNCSGASLKTRANTWVRNEIRNLRVKCSGCAKEMAWSAWVEAEHVHCCNVDCSVPGCAWRGPPAQLSAHDVSAARQHCDLYAARFESLKRAARGISKLTTAVAQPKKRKAGEEKEADDGGDGGHRNPVLLVVSSEEDEEDGGGPVEDDGDHKEEKRGSGSSQRKKARKNSLASAESMFLHEQPGEKRGRAQWKALSDDQKAPYQAKAIAARQRHRIDRLVDLGLDKTACERADKASSGKRQLPFRTVAMEAFLQQLL